MQSTEKCGRTLKRWPKCALFTAMATVVLADLAAAGLKGEVLFKELGAWPQAHHGLVTVLVTAAFVFCSFALYHMREELMTPKSILEKEVTPHRCLIMPLSYPTVFTTPGAARVEDVIGGHKIKYNDAYLPMQSIEEDIKALNGSGWPWQQFLRGLAKHQRKDGRGLEAVYLIGTKGVQAKKGTREQKGSFEVLKQARFLVKEYMKLPETRILAHDSPVHAESFKEISDAINEGIRELILMGYTERDIVIDVTGATKVVSIAGAAVTVNKEVKFQYVQTAPEDELDYKVKVYDVITRSQVKAE